MKQLDEPERRLSAGKRSSLAAVAVALSLSLTACLSAPPLPPAVSDKPEMRPEVFFAGRTRGTGELEVRGRAPRPFRVDSTGQMEGDGTFRLEQTVTYADGAVETRTWRLRATDASSYSGTLSDAAGEVSARTNGNVLHLRYLLRQPAVYMEQRLYLQPNGGSAINFATVTVAGVPLARLAEQIVRTAH
jgi:hypothetical protein